MNNSIKQNLYFWSGLDNQGNAILGSDHAASITILKYNLLKENIVPENIKKQNNRFAGFKQWSNSRHTLFFFSQLAAMLKTGINLNAAILILKSHQHEKLLTRLYNDIYRRINMGGSLSQALKNYPVLFDNVTVQIIKNGEVIGQTDLAVQQAGDYIEQKLHTSNALLTALLYPLILGLVTISVLGIMVIFVIPQFESVYAQSNNELPMLTSVVLSISEFTRNNLTLMVTAVFVICLSLKLLKKSTNIEIVRFIPRLNRTLIQTNTLRLCQTLNNLYRSGLPLTDSLLLCKNLSSSPSYQKALDQTLENIQQGHELGQALHDTYYFEAIFIQLIKTGEQAASLSAMLEQCASFYQKQLGDSLARLKIILEPLLIVFLGSIIAVILIAMYLPVFNIGSGF